MPIAASRLMAPVGIASTRTRGASAPIRMMAPLPHVFSICVIARLRAFLRSSVSLGASFSAAMSVLDTGWEPPRERPEYIPKPRLAPAGAERVCHVLQPAVHDRNAVEAVDVGGLAAAVHPHARRLHQLAPLDARDRLERAAERRPAAGFHLHETDQVPLTRDQVDLGVTHPEPMRHDVAPARQEVTDRLLLPRQAAPLALVLPFRWIAPQPDLHAVQSNSFAQRGRTISLRVVCICCEPDGRLWRLVEVGGGWWRLVEVGGGWWRLVEVGGGWVGNLHQPPPSFTTFTNLPAQCPNTFVRPTIPPVMLTTTHRKRRLSPIPAPSFGTT